MQRYTCKRRGIEGLRGIQWLACVRTHAQWTLGHATTGRIFRSRLLIVMLFGDPRSNEPRFCAPPIYCVHAVQAVQAVRTLCTTLDSRPQHFKTMCFAVHAVQASSFAVHAYLYVLLHDVLCFCFTFRHACISIRGCLELATLAAREVIIKCVRS